MRVALKIWRYDSATGDRALKEYEIEAPEWATLLDCLDIVKDQQDGSLAFRKSCRMMICGSCGMRMDGAAVLACKTRMYDIAQSGHVPVVSAMGNLPIRKDLVVDMDPFWSKFRAMGPWLEPGYERPEDGREYRVSQERMNHFACLAPMSRSMPSRIDSAPSLAIASRGSTPLGQRSLQK